MGDISVDDEAFAGFSALPRDSDEDELIRTGIDRSSRDGGLHFN